MSIVCLKLLQVDGSLTFHMKSLRDYCDWKYFTI